MYLYIICNENILLFFKYFSIKHVDSGHIVFVEEYRFRELFFFCFFKLCNDYTK